MRYQGKASERATALMTLVVSKKSSDLPDDVLTLATMNASKGLEWEKVWIADVNEGGAPKVDDIRDKEGVAEERRLLFVAITRAEKVLRISYNPKEPSQFIDEITR